ncbi:hypothetical protein GQ53DRAFT_343835 [Thozetella sp. PMI_491]|nr:hypothetical protein GQ53DRAFT_343835 [Thozetella sp. PMI_491]
MSSCTSDEEAAIHDVTSRRRRTVQAEFLPRRPFIASRAPSRSLPGYDFGYPAYRPRRLNRDDQDDLASLDDNLRAPTPPLRSSGPAGGEDDGSDDPYYDKYIHRAEDRLRDAMSAHSAYEDGMPRGYPSAPEPPRPFSAPFGQIAQGRMDYSSRRDRIAPTRRPAPFRMGSGIDQRFEDRFAKPPLPLSEGARFAVPPAMEAKRESRFEEPVDHRRTSILEDRRRRGFEDVLRQPSRPMSESASLGALNDAPDLIYTAESSSDGSDQESGNSSPWLSSKRDRGDKRPDKPDMDTKRPPHKAPKAEPPEWREPKWILPDGSVTELLSIRSAEVQVDRAGKERVVLVCPNRPQAAGPGDGDESTGVQMRWLHVQSPDPQLQVLSRLVLDCPHISIGLQSAALSLLDTALRAKDGNKDSGAAVRNQKAKDGGEEQALFMSMLHLDLFARHPQVHSTETGTKSLLEFLYSDDVGHDRESKQVVRKMKVGSSCDLLHVSPLWCLLLGSKILVTFSHLTRSEICGELIEVDTRGARGFYTVSVEYRPGVQHNIVIEPDCSYVDFLRQAVALRMGGPSSALNYDLLMADEIEPITASRWLQLLSSEGIEKRILRLVPKNPFRTADPDMPYSRSTSEYGRSRNTSRHSSVRMRGSLGGGAQYMDDPFALYSPFMPAGRASYSGYSSSDRYDAAPVGADDYLPYPPPPPPPPPLPVRETPSPDLRPYRSSPVRRGRRRASSSSGSYTGTGFAPVSWSETFHNEHSPGRGPSRTSTGQLTVISTSASVGPRLAHDHTYGQFMHERLIEALPEMQNVQLQEEAQAELREAPEVQGGFISSRALPRGPLFARFPAPPLQNEDDGIRVYPLPSLTSPVVEHAHQAPPPQTIVIRAFVDSASPSPSSESEWEESAFKDDPRDSMSSEEYRATERLGGNIRQDSSAQPAPGRVQIRPESEPFAATYVAGPASRFPEYPSLRDTLAIAPAPAPLRSQTQDTDVSFQPPRTRSPPRPSGGRNPRHAFVESDVSPSSSDEEPPSQPNRKPAFAPADIEVEGRRIPVSIPAAPRRVRFEATESVRERSASPRRPETPEQHTLEILGIQILPFFCWRLKSSKDNETPEETDKALFRVLCKINRSLQRDTSRKLYKKAYKCTMQDVLQRYAEVIKQHDATTPTHEDHDKVESNQGGSEHGSSRATPPERSAVLTISETNGKAAVQSSGDTIRTFGGSSTRGKGKGRLSSLVPGLSGELLGAWKLPGRGGSDSRTPLRSAASTNRRTSLSSEESEEGTRRDSGARQPSVDSNTITLVKNLVEQSQALMWAFLPKEGSSQIHQVCGRFWGAVDEIIRHLLWPSPGDLLQGQRWAIRDFDSAIDGSVAKKKFIDCTSCKNSETYPQAWGAIQHLHDQHIKCTHATDPYGQPSDDPCFAWLYSTRRGSGRENLVVSQVDILVQELTRFNKTINDVHSLVAHCRLPEDSKSSRPLLPSTLVHAFEELVVSYVVSSRYLSLVLQSRAGGEEATSAQDRQKIRALKNREVQAVFAVHNMLDWAKKDVILSSSMPSDVDALGINAVGAEFLVATLATAAQDRPVELKSKISPVDLYRDYISKLRYQANRRAQRRIFLDVHNLEEELEALRGLVNKQRDQLEWYLDSIDPGNSLFEEDRRFESYQVEKDYTTVQIRKLRRRAADISRLQDRCKALKDQVKQTLEIIEEDHGKAIRVFTIVTLFFLPMSFVTGFMGMNTDDIRNMENTQVLFWSVAVPVTVFVLSLAFVYAYKGDNIEDWVSSVLQPQRRPPPPKKPKRAEAPKIASDALALAKSIEIEGEQVPFWRQYGRRKNKLSLARRPTIDSDLS